MFDDRIPEIRTRITEDDFGGFRITIPSLREWPTVLFLMVWLCGWAVGEFVVGAHLFAWALTGVGPKGGSGFFLVLVFWLAGWTFAGFYTFSALSWNLSGREVIVLGDEAITLTRQVSWLSRSRWVDLAGVRNLRYAHELNRRSMNQIPMPSPWNGFGVVAFDHGSTTYLFGDHLPEIEARRLIATILERYEIPEDRDFPPLPVSR